MFGVPLGVAVAVGVAVALGVELGVAVAVGVVVALGVELGVGVGIGVGWALRTTPPPAVPANADDAASIATAQTVPPTGINPLLMSLQSSPLLVERKAPPAAPAKM